jgi:hypothetical protein
VNCSFFISDLNQNNMLEKQTPASALCGIIGFRVDKASTIDHKVVLTFQRGAILTFDTSPDHCSNPEALELITEDGPIYIW